MTVFLKAVFESSAKKDACFVLPVEKLLCKGERNPREYRPLAEGKTDARCERTWE
jgi:hypothetical protein